MNYKKLGQILGKIMILEGTLMIAPLIVSLVYNEGIVNALAFIVPVIILVSIGSILQIFKPKTNMIYQKEGFALVVIVWLVMSLFGAIPFVINGDIPNYVDAFFEITSGFTTTGASVITDITTICHSSLFWRSFSHWIGGMGILVFVLIFIPESNDGSSMHLLRAESSGPQVGKIVSKMKVTTRILYLIYLGMTILQVLLLSFDKPIAGYENDKFFYSLLATFGCAGTGGFTFIPGSISLFSPYSQYVMAIFMILYGVNFSLYYLILIGQAKSVVRSEEFRAYFIIIAVAVTLVFTSLVTQLSQIPQGYTIEEAFRHSLFQVASIITTTGYTTTDYLSWPTISITIFAILMLFGAMAGSTSGGIKLSRIIITVKGMYVNVRKLINPRYVPKVKVEGKTLEEKTISGVFSYVTLYFLFIFLVAFLLSFDAINGQTVQIVSDAGTYSVKYGFFTNLSASLSCISNIGPGFEAIGPYASFASYNQFSKIIMSFAMLLGRLGILPVLLFLNPRTWKKL